MTKICKIYSKIISKENLYRSAYMASRGRRYRDTTADFNFHLEEEIEKLHNELTNKTYRHGKYRVFTVYDPKEREIAAAPFRDRVVHHAVHDIIEPVIDETFIHDSYACRQDKGTHKAVGRAQSFLRVNRYCFHGDVKKYFFSINRCILKEILRERIEDRDLLWLLNEIVDSALEISDDKGSVKGLPIGNLTSQFFANLYLNELDRFIKFNLKQRYYLRYMDDFLVFSSDRNELTELKGKIRRFLKDKLELNLHEGKSQIFKTEGGIKFLGFRIYGNYRRLVSDNARRFKKRLKKFAFLLRYHKIKLGEVCDSVRCWTAHSRYANTKKLRLNIWTHLKEKNERFANTLKDVLLDGIITGSERE